MSLINRFFHLVKCAFGAHDMETLPSPPGIMRGIYAPQRCRACEYKQEGFPYPVAYVQLPTGEGRPPVFPSMKSSDQVFFEIMEQAEAAIRKHGPKKFIRSTEYGYA